MNRFRRILVPHDFSPHATKALEFALDLAQSDGRVFVLHVVVPFVPVSAAPGVGVATYVSTAELVTGARRELDRTVAKTCGKRRGPVVDAKIMVGDPYQRIIEAARGMDAIVMSTAGRTGLSHLLIGSVAEKVVRHSPIPVVTLRAGARKAKTRR
jgi:nucleotide-binding universal stress UspA family protein